MAVLVISASAQSSSAKKYIKKYDVINILKDLPKGNAEKFWDTLHDQNKRVQELGNAIELGNKTALQAADDLMKTCTVMQYYDVEADGYQELTDRLVKELGLEDEKKQNHIKVINDDSFNASMDPMGQMRINTGAIRALNYEELRAVCAHEVAHLACMHTFDRAWKNEKKKKRNRFWAELGTGLLVGAAAASAGYGIANGVETRSANSILANTGYFLEVSHADESTLRYKFRYSRDEEVEADIIAYRFVEYMGYGTEHLISAMKKMERASEHTAASKYDSHPLPALRLEILQALKNGFEGKGSSKKKKQSPSDDMYK